jgi:hypothetical protein
MKNAFLKQKWEIIGSLFLVAVFVLPMFVLAGNRKDIYVDGSKSGIEDGTSAHPYHTISEALDHANDRTNVHIAEGLYRDNIEIPKGVEVYGSDSDEVTIRAKKSNKVVVSMKDGSKIDGVTIEKGKSGIWVAEKAEASISKCVIKNNDGDGIKIGYGKVSDKTKVSITKSRIEDNGKSGIYSGKRRLVLINNEIIHNDKDGIDVAAGSSAWIEKNEIKNNKKSGMKLVLDGSDIWTKNNSIRENGGEGAEINAFGGTGRIDMNKNKFVKNARYGIARVARGNFSASIWNGLTVQSSTTFDANSFGTISRIITVL